MFNPTPKFQVVEGGRPPAHEWTEEEIPGLLMSAIKALPFVKLRKDDQSALTVYADGAGLWVPSFARMSISAPVLPGLFFGCNSMLIRVTCPCGHIGLINAETLPRDLVCSHCGARRRIERKDGARIVNRVAPRYHAMRLAAALPGARVEGASWLRPCAAPCRRRPDHRRCRGVDRSRVTRGEANPRHRSLSLGKAHRGPKATITACADFVGTLGRKGARLFARMV